MVGKIRPVRNLFNKYYKEYDDWYDKNRYAYLSEIEAIEKVLPKKGKGLEIGVGTGRFASRLGIRYGIDPSAKMLKIAKRRGIKTEVAYGENLPFGNNEFDYILIAITICFANNPKKVIAESKRVLKKDGRIIIGIVDKNSFLGKYYRKKKSKFYKAARFFSVERIVNLLKKQHFSNFSFWQAIFDFPSQIKEIETPRRGFGKGAFAVICALNK